MKSIILSLGDTNISNLKEYFVLDNEVSFLFNDDRINYIPKYLFLDCSINFYDNQIDINLLYQKFSKILLKIENLDLSNTKIIIIINYFFNTNDRLLNLKQKLLEQFINIIIEFYSAYIIFLPFIISRILLNNYIHPIFSIINSIRFDKICKIPFRSSSRFFIINDLDFLNLFFEIKNKEISNNIIIEGIEITLDEIFNKTTKLGGYTPVNFDSKIFINYNFPEKISEIYNSINYTFDDMLVDFVTKLF